MCSPTDDIKMKTTAFYDEYEGKILDVIDSESQDKYLALLPEYVNKFPTLQESVYLAIFNSYPELNECYNDYQLTSLKEGKKEHPKVLESKNYHRTHKLKGTAYSRYYDEMVIKPNITKSGMTKESCYHFRFSQDPELSRRYVDYKLESVLTGASPKAFVEKCRDAYRTKNRTMPFFEFYYKEFYEYDYLYRHNPELLAVYTDCTLMVLRDGKKELNDILEKKELWEKDYKENTPNKPFWCYFCKKFYDSRMDKLPAQEFAVKNLYEFLNSYKKTDIWKRQGYLLQNAQSAARVRNIAFHLAVALGMKVSALEDLLQKCLLQTAFNPKSPREAIYWYCLYNRIPYEDMLSQYLAYVGTDSFQTKYGNYFKVSEYANTEYWLDRLTDVLSKDKDAFYKFLWRLIHSLRENPDMKISRRAAAENFWTYFCSFPQKVWTGKNENAKQLISAEDMYTNFSDAKKDKIPKADWLSFMENQKVDSLMAVYDKYKEFDRVYDPVNHERKYKKRASRDIIESPYITELINREVGYPESETLKRKNKTVPISRYYEKGEYEAFLLLILKISQKNYYAEAQYKLLPIQTLKNIFKDLTFFESTMQDWKNGTQPLSRNNLIATVFISTSSDFFENHPEKTNPRKDRWEQFETEVNDMLEICGMGSFYERNPFELFVRLSFLYPDPLGYFLTSLKHAGIEINESNKKSAVCCL